MIKINCKICSNFFYVKPSHLKMGSGKYCSRRCHYLGKRKGEYVGCHVCKQIVYVNKTRFGRSKSNKYFCNKTCQTLWRNSYFKGSKHPNWTGGMSTYRNILKRSDKEKICTACGNKDVRVLAAHHLDKNRKNNTIDNLAWLCHNCHHLIHHYKDE
ncbi:MAG: hypothetical protein ACI9GH_000095 [Candidatus Paceibacteria bacterium]|jgi:hypothetical protein